MARAALAVEQEQETAGGIVAIVRSRKANTNEKFTPLHSAQDPRLLNSTMNIQGRSSQLSQTSQGATSWIGTPRGLCPS